MKYKLLVISLMLLVLFTCASGVFAEETDENATLETVNDEIESVPQEADTIQSTEITIDEDNYDTYFNRFTGKLKEDVDPNINTIKISNVSDKLFVIDRPMNVMPDSPTSEIRNGAIHLVEGSSGSNITNLIINNTKGEIYADGLFVSKLHGIWLSNSDDNLIFNNTIRIPGCEGCYAMPMGHSSRNRILYNDIKSTFTSCILMGLCDYNNISYNRIEITSFRDMVTSNLIYANYYGHADYRGPADCIGTYISNNYLKGFCNSDWSIIINLLGKCDDTVIVNNTVFKGSCGISVDMEDNTETKIRKSVNITVKNNTIINSTTSIYMPDNDVIISENTITGYSMGTGICISSDKIYNKTNITVCNNRIDYVNLGCGIDVGAPNSIVTSNVIRISKYGNGIEVNSINATVKDNVIITKADDGMIITNNSNLIRDNYITTFGNGIQIKQRQLEGIFKIYNNTIVENTILADKYAVYITGYVYNTVVSDNIIETNQSEAFYINVQQTFDDRNSGNFTDNTINGVIENTETLIINDTNFYDYFDEDGYLKYSFKPNSKKMLFFTFLSNKDIYLTDNIILTSNKMANLLYNVSITFKSDAGGSKISDFNFYNMEKSSIILDGVDDVVISNNEFTTVTDNIFEVNTISAVRGCNGCNITKNNIFMSSKANYTYGIYVSEPQRSVVKEFSRNFTISGNNILIKAGGVGEAMYFDALVESDIMKNSMNLITDGSAYGISACDVFASPYDLNIKSNEIFVNSKDMSYLIEIYRCHDFEVADNHVSGYSNGVYGIGIYDSQNISINGNEIDVCGLNLTDSRPSDALGKGNSAIYIARQSVVDDISNNIFDCENTKVIDNENSTICNIGQNSFVVSDYNHDLYFDGDNVLLNDTIRENDMLLFKNFTGSKAMIINIPLTISSYNHLNDFRGVLIISENASGSKVSGLNFVDASIDLNGTYGVVITDNSFISSSITVNGIKNKVSRNSFLNSSCVSISDSSSTTFNYNNVSVSCEFIRIINSNRTSISDNLFDSNNTAIYSKDTLNTQISGNEFNINASYGYIANNTLSDNILDNDIIIDSDNPTAIYYTGNSSKNTVKNNRIHSYSKEGFDYAVVVDSDTNRGNVITNNYLIASNGYKKGDSAVNASYDVVRDNTPVTLYVSANGSEDGNGTIENPYPSIAKAVENSLSGAIIHILPGTYNESNITIDKNITLTAENIEGNTYINALNSQLFNIAKGGILTVNALKIFNGFSVDGGSLFNNHGTLIISNSMIYNSSSYYDNSNYPYGTNSGSQLGIGGAILNRGELVIDSSALFNNLAHKGGAIADFGKTTIRNSLIINNSATHGGAIFTNSKNPLLIENSTFAENTAITTLDYCTIVKTETSNYGYRFVYSSECKEVPGHGGAIYSSTSMTIRNSTFEHNAARSGGAIAYPSGASNSYRTPNNEIEYYYFTSYYSLGSYVDLNIENSTFKYNEAKDTRCGNLSLLKTGMYDPTYGENCHGGAIFGEIRGFKVLDSLFEHNSAYDTGGALCVQVINSTIEGSKFLNNTAGSTGGAMEVFGNYNIFNTDISGNSAKKGGGIRYYPNGRDPIFNAFNVTISKNKALELGGGIIGGKMTITHSNIYDNTAPQGATFSGMYSPVNDYSIDARSNWWGSPDGPDSSVYSQSNIKYRTWLADRVNWGAVSINPSKSDDDNGNGKSNGKSTTSSSVSTGSGVHTGSTLKSNTRSSHEYDAKSISFNGNWPNGNNRGNFGGFSGIYGASHFHSNGSSKTSFKGNAINPNSLSKTNSSNVNNLASVGMTANAADSSPSAQSSQGEGSGGESVKAYEITKQIEDLEDIESPTYFILFIVLCIMFLIGFYRKYKSEE